MYRFYCPHLPERPLAKEKLSDVVVSLDPDQAHHARRVLRLRTDDPVQVFDGRGTVGQGVIRWRADAGTVRILQWEHVPPTRPRIDVAAATPKGQHATEMVSQLSQVGADRYIPLRTERGVNDPGQGQLARLNRVAIESAKQSMRSYLLTLEPPTGLDDVLARPYDLKLLTDLVQAAGDPTSNHGAIAGRLATTSGPVLILIGPEGGWTDPERQAIGQAGGLSWRLGPNVLRIETAATVAVALARHEWPLTIMPAANPEPH